MSAFREGASNAAAGAHAVVLVAKEVLLAALVRALVLVQLAQASDVPVLVTRGTPLVARTIGRSGWAAPGAASAATSDTLSGGCTGAIHRRTSSRLCPPCG